MSRLWRLELHSPDGDRHDRYLHEDAPGHETSEERKRRRDRNRINRTNALRRLDCDEHASHREHEKGRLRIHRERKRASAGFTGHARHRWDLEEVAKIDTLARACPDYPFLRKVEWEAIASQLNVVHCHARTALGVRQQHLRKHRSTDR